MHGSKCKCYGTVDVVVNSITLHCGDLGSIPGSGIQAVWIHC